MTTATQRFPAVPTVQPALHVFRRLARRLQALASLSPLSDAHLRDIGLIRHDIDAARRLPLSADVSTHMSIRAGMRAGNW